MYPRMNAGGRSERETNFRVGWNGSRFFCSGCVEFIALAGIHAKGLTGCIRIETDQMDLFLARSRQFVPCTLGFCSGYV